MFRRLSPSAGKAPVVSLYHQILNITCQELAILNFKVNVSFFSSFLKLIKLEKQAKQFGCDLCFKYKSLRNGAIMLSTTRKHCSLFFNLNQTLKKSSMFSSHPVWIIVTACIQGSASRQSPISSLSINHLTPVLATLHWLIFKLLLFTFKALHGLAPEYIFRFTCALWA